MIENKGIKMFEVLDKVCEPIRSTKYSAYVDLFAMEDVTIGAGETKIVSLGVKIDLKYLKEASIPITNVPTLWVEDEFDRFLKTHYLEIALRSSLAVKGLTIPNGIGIIDLDYPDEIGLIVHNPYTETIYKVNDRTYKIKKGDKVAQCTLKEHKGYLMGYESDVVRDGGFGSTDKDGDVV